MKPSWASLEPVGMGSHLSLFWGRSTAGASQQKHGWEAWVPNKSILQRQMHEGSLFEVTIKNTEKHKCFFQTNIRDVCTQHTDALGCRIWPYKEACWGAQACSPIAGQRDTCSCTNELQTDITIPPLLPFSTHQKDILQMSPWARRRHWSQHQQPYAPA